MTKKIHPTTQSLGLGSGVGPGSDTSLEDLRNGEREAFGRFFETYRSGIYGFVASLMRGHGDAAAITHEVFVRAYRKILLHNGAIDLRPWVYGVALDTCREHLAALPGSQASRVPLARAETPDDVDQQSDLARRFRQASEGLSDGDLAVLLLNDVHGLSYGETAAVMGVSAEAAKTLLFRAGEKFRGAFEALSGNQTVATCRFAEQEAATSVGRGLSADDTRRLHDHARYCEPCRATTATWGLGAAGLALFVGETRLPRALQKVPVFGTWAAPVVAAQAVDAKAAAGMGVVVGTLARFRAVVGSRATAYAVAAVCLVALVGVVMFGTHTELRKVIMFVPRPPSSMVVIPAHAPAKGAVVHHTARQGTGKVATRTTQPAHSAATASTAVVTTARLTSAHSSGTAPTGKSAAGAGDTPATSAGSTGAAGSTTSGSAPSSGGSVTTAGHSVGSGVVSTVGTAVGAGLGRSGHAARSHRHARHDGQSRRRARTSGRAHSHARSHSGSGGARSHAGSSQQSRSRAASSGHAHSHSRSGATNGAGRQGHGRGQGTHASRGSRAGGARSHGARGNRGGNRGGGSHSRRHGGRSGHR
jgi:RNA polymerase sigma factor (sigma-70 family)